ncbi:MULTISPECIES: glycerophosphodiester phosphodiesterase [unclassified Pseudomonas]|uniref:glycerophosphodiester phosphodiesterase n=1 Tax=unclassified Pseudomonas TaxID=196821 RepID=UPI000D3B6E44|nr:MULTISPECIES: glycerophosphodiester phosphodiesterase [unclassified Pseudomonas]RAU47334.1 glycerophosphodiester phosphodiesterase [Pseudomonas sp. RIT 409]RAU51992.1 glycerophosphodiester phosphodiesterase [Pseudomonas sp. RIT 412]
MSRSLLSSTALATTMAAVLLTSGAASAASDPGKALAAKAGIPWPAVIAHRGASFNAPEETLPAYTLARELGADYLEMDIQRTKDGVLIALHDDTLERTTNIAEVYPDRAKNPVSTFTLEELKRLDAGAWFNKAHPDRARASYAGLKILTLDEVIDIAEGGKNKPGLYIETKVPAQFPGIEEDLKAKLEQRGWLSQRPAAEKGYVNVAHMPGRVVLQTFEKPSLDLLHKAMPNTPKVLLLWLGDGYIQAESDTTFKDSGAKDKAAFYASQKVKSKAEFAAWMDWAKAHGAIGTGPAAALKNGGDQSYMDLVQPWMNTMAHERGLIIHPYTVDDAVDFKAITARGVDGFFTNRASELLKFYGRPSKESMESILKRIGY